MAGVNEPYVEVEDRGVAVPEGPEMARREDDDDDAFVEDRDKVVLSEKNRRVDEARFGGAKFATGGESGGEFGPRRSFSR